MDFSDPIQTALLIRRSALKLSDVPVGQRSIVAVVLYRMSDAQASQIAARQERPRRSLGRSHAFGWKAGS